VKWEGCTWRTADGELCEADDPRRDYLLTRYSKEVPRLFIDEGESVDNYVRKHPNWAEEQKQGEEEPSRSTGVGPEIFYGRSE
jgi:hypothetical protein